MKHAEENLHALMTMVKQGAKKYITDKGVEDAFDIAAIILYGGAARYHFDISSEFADYDLNIFFRKTAKYKTGIARKINRRGKAYTIGFHNGKKVEILFNVLADGETATDFIKTRGSKRWKNRISKDPILFLFPERKDFIAITA